MRRSPFYAYPTYPFSTPIPDPYARDPYRPQQQPRRSSPPTSAPSRSVVSIPVFDSSSPTPPALLPQRKTSVDPIAAATRIQSCFRGYAIRRRRPLLHLGTISALKKRLEGLKAELESPGFSNKVKSNERERLRFSESVMAVILQLDAIEGSIPDVRNQRKEATKMAIKLQDAMDAILSSQEEETGANSSLAVNLESIDDANALQETSPSVHKENLHEAQNLISMMQDATAIVDEEIHNEAEVVNQELQGAVVQDEQKERVKAVAFGDGVEDFAARDDSGELIDCDEHGPSSRQAILCGSSESSGVQAEGSDGTCPVMVGSAIAPCGQQADQITQEDMGSVTAADDNGEMVVDYFAADKALKGFDVCEKDIKDLRLCSISGPGNPCAKDPLDAVNSSKDYSPVVDNLMNTQAQILTDQLQGKTPAGVSSVPQDGLENLDASDSVILKKLSQDCGQLEVLLGKLLAQSKAQSKVIRALGDRLEMLEQQQQLGCQKNQQREKRKQKKGSKQREKCCKHQ